MSSVKFLRRLAAITAASLMTTGAGAHHSFAAFDLTKTVEVRGAVKEWRWANPHSLLVLATLDPQGAAQEMSFEANGPGYLVRQGWKRESLKPGDTITVMLNPMQDGSLGGNLVSVTFADGRSLSAAPARAATPPAAPPATAVAPAKGEQTKGEQK